MKTTKMLGKFGDSWRNLVPDGLKFAMFLVLGVAWTAAADTRYDFTQKVADENGNYLWTNPANWNKTDTYPGDPGSDVSDAWAYISANTKATVNAALKPINTLSGANSGAWLVVTNGGSMAVKSTSCNYGNTLVSGNESSLWNTNNYAIIKDGCSFTVNDGGVVTAGGSQSGKRGFFFNNNSSSLIDGGAFTNDAFFAVLRNNATLTVRNGGAFYKGGTGTNPFFFGNRDAVETSTNSEIRVESRGLFKANVLSFGDGNDTTRDNRAIVTGEGSILWCFSAADNASGIRVYGKRNSIEVSNGALLSCVRNSADPLYTGSLNGQNPWGDILLGVGNTPDPSGDDNALTVDDATAFVRGNVVIGSSGSGNRITLRNGAFMRMPQVSSFPISLRLGDSAASVSNSLSIADSSLYVSGSIVVGVNGGFNRLELAGNAIITNTESSTGFVFGQNSSSNRFEVKAGGNKIAQGTYWSSGNVTIPVLFTNDTVLAFNVPAGGYGGKPGVEFAALNTSAKGGKVSFADLGNVEFDVKAWTKGGAEKGDSVTLMRFSPVSHLEFTKSDGTVVADTAALTALAERLQEDAGDAPVKITAENGTDIVCTYRGGPGLVIFVR